MLIGREAERSQIERLLAAARLGTSGVLVVSGDPGIGKTALVEHAVERAAGMAVLRARGVQSEAEIPFAGLLALLRPALDRLDDLPATQAAALRGALALAPDVERDRFAIGAATLSLLAAHAEQRPTLVAIDDAHWLDESSLAAILFAARRLLADAVAVLIAVRADTATPVLELDLPELRLEGLDRETAAAVLERHAEAPLPPGATDRLFAATLGNPLARVELAAVAADLRIEPGEPPAPVETSVERAFGERIAALPPMARRVLALAAAEDSGDLAVVEQAASSLRVQLSELAAGERAGLVSISFGRLAFRHPLTRSAAYRAAPADERRRAHRAIAAALAERSEPDRRAWHLAAAALGPDPEAAAALAAAGRRSRARSAYPTAATSFERAARLSAAGPDHGSLLFAAAESAWLGGDARRTGRLLEDARRTCTEPRLRAGIDHLSGHVALRSGRVMDGHDILVDAATRALPHDPGDAVVMLAEAADACAYAARPRPMLAVARRAWAALAPTADERERFFATLALGMALIYNGQGDEGAGLLRDATTLLERSDALSGDPRLLSSAALGPLWLREAATSRTLVERAIEAARQQGAVGALPFALWLAARDAATSDRWPVAQARYEEAIRLARETGQATSLCAGLAGLSCVEARQGREPACREHAGEALALSADLGLGFFRIWALDALAELEAGLGRHEVAIERLEEKEQLLVGRDIGDPDASGVPELVEALVRLDRAAEAHVRLELFARRARAKAQPWALARLERCRGLLAGPGELSGHFDAALRLHELTPDRFEEAHTRLCHGERLRRTRRRVRARAELHRAIQAFDALGAAPWAERARLELEATGERARRRDVSTLDQLTPRELQVALVLADGHTTREAAAKLFLSPKTVEYHLRHTYRKLGVASRTALAAALASESPGGPLMRPPQPGTTVASTPGNGPKETA